MRSPSNPEIPAEIIDNKIKGKTKAKHRMIAELIARGFSVKEVAQQVNLSESQISHLLGDKESFVNTEISRILSNLFTENDRHLIDLYRRALQKLDNILSSSDEEKQFRAIDKIIKIFLTRSAKNGVTIQQYFGVESQEEEGGEPKSIDEFIIRRRKERGLDKLHLDEDSDEDSSDSAPENSASPASASPTPVSETAAPNESSRGYSPPDLPAEIRKFVDDMNEPPPSE